MGGGAMNLDLPMIQFCTSSSKPSSPSTSSKLNLPVSANHTATLKQSFTASSCSGHSDSCIKLDGVDKTEDKRASGWLDNSVFGSVPSNSEVENAVAALQSFVHGISTCGPGLKWLQALGSCDPRILVALGYGGRVYNTFRMLQTDPSVKRLVVSLSSDKAVWDAVMNNELVRKLRELPYPAKNERHQNTGEEESTLVSEILRWILDTTKAKVTELIEKFQALMEVLFKPLDGEITEEENRGDLEEKVRSSLMLSVVILLIVVVARLHTS